MPFLPLYTYDLPVDISSLFSLCGFLAPSLNARLNLFTVGMSWYIILSTKLVFFFSALLSPLEINENDAVCSSLCFIGYYSVPRACPQARIIW